MEFLKKNWGLLLCAVVFVGVMIYQLSKITAYQAAYKASEAKITEAQNWFNTIRSEGLKILPEENGLLKNAEIADVNMALAESHSKQLHNQLRRDFAIPEDPSLNLQDITSDKVKELLGDRIQSLMDEAAANGIQWVKIPIADGLFDTIARERQIAPIKFKLIFRQLYVYEHVIRLIARSGVKQVNTVEFPRGLALDSNEADYTLTPIILSVEASPQIIQTLVNNITQDPNMFFIIRNMSFVAVQNNLSSESPELVFSNIVTQKHSRLAKAQQDVYGGNGVAGMGGSDRPGNGGREMMGADMGVGYSRAPGSSGTGASRPRDENWMVPEDARRQDYLIFRNPQRAIQLNLTLDLLEFKQEDTGEEEGEEEPEPEP